MTRSAAGDGAGASVPCARLRRVACPRCRYPLHDLGTIDERPPPAVRCSECGIVVDAGRAYDILEESRLRRRPPPEQWRRVCRPAFAGALLGLVSGKVHLLVAIVRPEDPFRGSGFWSIDVSLAVAFGCGGLVLLVSAWREGRRTPGAAAASLAVAAALVMMVFGTTAAVVAMLALAQGAWAIAGGLFAALAVAVAFAALLDHHARNLMLTARLLEEAVIEPSRGGPRGSRVPPGPGASTPSPSPPPPPCSPAPSEAPARRRGDAPESSP